MIDDRTRQLRAEGFRKAEASLRLEGMDPSGTPRYESVKARILSGVSLDIENYCTVSLFFEQTYL